MSWNAIHKKYTINLNLLYLRTGYQVFNGHYFRSGDNQNIRADSDTRNEDTKQREENERKKEDNEKMESLLALREEIEKVLDAFKDPVNKGRLDRRCSFSLWV